MADLQKQKIKEVQDLFNKNDLHHEFSVNGDGYIEITVIDGDWKHDHLRLKHIMHKAGYVFIGRYVPDEETGDDSYTGVYLYR